VGLIASMQETEDTHSIRYESLAKRTHQGNCDTDGKTILKCLLGKLVVMVRGVY
jgi:hypothetical protein